MSDRLDVIFTKCAHDSWQSHNAILFDDGTTTPDDACDGGIADVQGIGKFRISPIMAMSLRSWSDALTEEGNDG